MAECFPSARSQDLPRRRPKFFRRRLVLGEAMVRVPESLPPLNDSLTSPASAPKRFDKNTVDKIHILSSSSLTSTLSQHIPLSSIPRKYGGELEWEFGAPGPSLDPETSEVLGLREGERCPAGPVRWVEGRLRVVGGKGRSEEERRRWNDGAPDRQVGQAEGAPRVNGVSNGGTSEEDEQEERAEKREGEVVEPASTASSAANGATSPPYIDAPSPSAAPTSLMPVPAPPTESTKTTTVDAPLAAESTSLPPPLSNSTPYTPSSFVPQAMENGTTHEKDDAEDEDVHDIHVAARENPGAPVKELASVLEGTTL